MTINSAFSWEKIDQVFLDMDGTLLDKYYDDYFWLQFVPQCYAEKNGVDFIDARRLLTETYRNVENTLAWTDLDYWSEHTGLDIAAMKKEIDHLVQIHPHVIDFLEYIKSLNKKLYLVTNAHPEAIKVKMNKVNLCNYFEKMVCSKEVGAAKEQPTFWEKLQSFIAYDKARTLFADDTERVLMSAREYGISHLVHIARPSSKLPIQYSQSYPSIVNFKELIF
jgi:HAD superfamily hydrolase (TIGR01509 family)